MRQTRSLRINAPPAKVWELIDDDDKVPKWMPHIVSTRYPGGRPKGDRKGARFVQEMRQGDVVSSYEGEITEYQHGKLLGVMTRPEAFAIHAVYHVSGDEDWTRLDYGCDVKPMTWRGYMMVWWMRKVLNRILDQQLARLKWVAEGRQVDI
jgi:hypothetical protein